MPIVNINLIMIREPTFPDIIMINNKIERRLIYMFAYGK